MMLKIMLTTGLMAGVLMLGACASHTATAGKTSAQLVNGAGNDSGSGKRICVRHTRDGTHIAHVYCMTPSQYRQYQKDQQEEQEMFQKQTESTPQAKGCSGPKC